MKTLLLQRHAKSSWKFPKLSDHDRPLNPRGERDAPKIGRLIEEEESIPDLILSSTAIRARKTAEAVALHSGYLGEILFSQELYGADFETFIELIHDISDDYYCVMLVGHNPGLEDLLEMLTGEYDRMPTSTLAQVELPILTWKELSEETEGSLINLWRPRELW